MQPPKCIRHINQQLSRITKSHWALSTVVTTLIILVISVLLAGVVTYFAINVTSTRVQEESLDLAKQHVWFDFASSKTQAAIMIINSGGRDVVIEKLTVRGQQCDWSKVFFNQTAASVSGDLSYASSLSDSSALSIGGTSFLFKQASSAITLQSGKTLIIYLNNPDSISVNDIGLTVSVNIFTSQTMYYKETNVQGTSGTQTVSSTPSPTTEPSGITISLAKAYYHYEANTDSYQIPMVITNSGSYDELITLSNLLIKGNQASHPLILSYYKDVSISVTADDLVYFPTGTGAIKVIYELGGLGESFTLQAGYTAIVYFGGNGADVTIGDVSHEITVGITLDAGGSLTKTVTVSGTD